MEEKKKMDIDVKETTNINKSPRVSSILLKIF